MVMVGALGRRPCPVGGVDMVSGFRGHRKQGVCGDALLERQRDMQQHVPRRKLKEECSWDQSASAVLDCVGYRLRRSKAVQSMRRYIAQATHELEMRLRASASVGQVIRSQ